MSDPRTIGVYDTRADDYADMTDHDNETDPQLNAFIAACPAGGTVLDLGCGPGAAAAVMAARGLQVDAVDASAAMIERAAAQRGVNARQATFDDIDGNALYDGVWANFCLLHARRKDLPRHLLALRRALKPGGHLFIGMKLGEGEARDDLGRHYAYYSAAELDRMLQDAGFIVTAHRFGRSAGLSGRDDDWVQVSAVKAGALRDTENG